MGIFDRNGDDYEEEKVFFIRHYNMIRVYNTCKY